MKVTINGDEYETSTDWTFREEKEVRRLAGVTRGEVFGLLVEGSTLGVIAFAIVGHMRAKPGVPCDFLMDLKPGAEVTLDLGDPTPETPKKTTRSRARS